MANKVYRRTFTVNPTVDTNVYAAGDAIDVLQSVAEALRGADQSGIIEQVNVVDASGQDAELDLIFYRASVTDGTDNAAYAPSEAELKESAGVIKIVLGDYAAFGTPSVATVNPNLHLQFEGSKILRFQIVSRGTPTYAGADDLQIQFVIKQD